MLRPIHSGAPPESRLGILSRSIRASSGHRPVPIGGELSGIFGTLVLPLAGIRLVLGLHVPSPRMVFGFEERRPVLVVINLPMAPPARWWAGTSTIPAVGVRDIGHRTGAVASWVVSIQPWVVVAAAGAVVVAAHAAVVEPTVTAGMDECRSAARVANAACVAGIVRRVVARGQGACANGQK